MFSYRDLLCVIHDGVETMCYGKNSTVLKLTADGGLDQRVCLQVQSGCRFIQHQNLCLSEKSSRQANQLPLTKTEEYKDKNSSELITDRLNIKIPSNNHQTNAHT